jgi:hypothetical protein
VTAGKNGGVTAHPPVVIEAALNGMTTRARNPHVPRTVDEIVDSGLACVDAGASILHNHNDEPNFGGATRHCAEPYLAAWRRLLQRHPRLLLHPTTAGATPDSTVEERFAHVTELHEAGVLGLGTCDAGTIAIAFTGEDAGPPVALSETFGNTARDVEWALGWFKERELPVHVSIFEPGMLRLILAHHRAGSLPRSRPRRPRGPLRPAPHTPKRRAGRRGGRPRPRHRPAPRQPRRGPAELLGDLSVQTDHSAGDHGEKSDAVGPHDLRESAGDAPVLPAEARP